MTQNITKYYIPQNLNIQKGKIYTLYLNKITNLDLTSIVENELIKTSSSNTTNQQQKLISVTNDDYNIILKLIETSNILHSQTQELEMNIKKGRVK